MTEPRDPIDDWLRTDVELMMPRPGAFEQIHRRARRRKAVRATSSAAGVAILVAAGAALPQVASALLPSQGSQANVGGATSPQRSTTHPPGGRSTRPSPVSTSHRGRALPITSTAVPPVTPFRVSSVTFVNQSVGAVIGQAGSTCATGSCTAVAGTPNYGRSWWMAGAPRAGAPNGDYGVSQIRFLDPRDGWAYGPELFATHDGGATWTKVSGLPSGRVIDLATVGSRAFAVVATCTGSGSDYAGDCTSFQLVSAGFDSDRWMPVPGAAASLPVRPGGLQLTGQYGYLLAGRILYAGPVTGGAWHTVTGNAATRPPCLSATVAAARARQPAALIAPGSPGQLFLACGGAVSARQNVPGPLTLYESPDSGLDWSRKGTIAAAGTPTSLAVAPVSGTLVLTTSSGIFSSADQRDWRPAGLGGPVPTGGFAFVGMTTTTEGVAVPADSLGEIFITGDGGLDWQAVVIK
ncbi:MAG TPA: hypothetical protein VNF47_01075 [Streptosporangiaceae bacterium]|nr:hypothetical protein [Streptosporangiaceae bacterium]